MGSLKIPFSFKIKNWYSKLQDIPNYELIEETESVILTKGKLHVENCGYLKYKRKS